MNVARLNFSHGSRRSMRPACNTAASARLGRPVGISSTFKDRRYASATSSGAIDLNEGDHLLTSDTMLRARPVYVGYPTCSPPSGPEL